MSEDWCAYDDVHHDAVNDWLNERPPAERPAPGEYEGLGALPRGAPPRPLPIEGCPYCAPDERCSLHLDRA